MREAKHSIVMRLLRSRILRGLYKDRLPGEVELAKEMGVSTVTLGHALMRLEAVGLIQRRWRSGTFVVPQEERAEVFAPMSVLFSAEPRSSATVTYAFGQAAQARGLEMALVMHSNEEPDKALDDILTRLKNVTCVGTCIIDYPMDNARAMRLASAPGPVVLADWETPDLILPTITYDDREAGRIAAAHLLKLGHRRITLVDAIPTDPARTARTEGVAELVRQAGGTFRELRTPDFTWGVPPCLAILQAPERPTAILCGGMGTAVDIVTAAGSLGLGVPRDVSVMCIANISPSRPSEVFTFVRFDEHALGAGALELLLDTVPGEEPQLRRVPVRLDDRGTTAPPSEQK